jgi:L-arabinose isomerase
MVENLGLVDTPQGGREAGHTCRRADVDLLVIYVTTYALSNTVLPMVQRAKVQVLVLNLQPSAAIDYEAFNRLPNRTAMTGEWLAYCSACTLPEIANVLLRAGLPFHQVTGVLGEEATWTEIEEWIEAAKVKKALAGNRLGLMGHYYNGMLDIVTDLTKVSILFGTHVEQLEVDELTALRRAVSDAEIAQRVAEFRIAFDVQLDCAGEELARAARTSVALDRLAEQHELNSLAYFSMGSGVAENEDTMSSVILGTSLLTARGIPVAGEYEVKNALAMKIMDSLGAGGSFTEYYAMDLKADHVLMGHDGPAHLAMAESKTIVRPLQVYHGKVGSGLSVEMSVKHGPVTLLAIVEDAAQGFKLLVAEGESVPGEVLRIGNTNSHYRFPLGARGFVEAWNAQGPAHHCAIGVGHLSSKLRKLAQLLRLPLVQVC